MGLKSDGSIRRWGCNGPCEVPSPNTGFVAIATHFYHSLAVRTDGSIVAWGEYDQSSVPLPNTGYLAVTANRGFAYALRSDAPDPVFSEAPPISTSGGQTITAVAADIDGDGDQDIVSAEYGVNVVAWYENSGGAIPVWTKRFVDSFASGPQTVAVADVDRDGDPDIFSANFNEEGVEWYENDGSKPPVWTPHVITTAAPQAIAVSEADLDGDSDLDVVSGAWENEIAWYESDGGAPPAFTRRVISNDCSGPEGVFAARLDPDADVDILAACNITGRIHWYPNNANFMESDGDCVQDALDCAPADATAFAAPTVIRNVQFASPASRSWGSGQSTGGTGTFHDVMRGSLAQFPVGSGTGEACLANGAADATLPEATVPAVGTGFYYLVRGSNACGVGTYGFTTSSAERASTTCP